MPFLASCTCEGTVCKCTDVFGHLDASSQTKATPMTKPLTLIDIIRGASDPDRHKALDQINAAAKHLPTAELKTLISVLSAEAKNQEARNSAKGQRLARLEAAAKSDDGRVADARQIAASGLKRLGMGELNAHAASGINVPELETKMRSAKWGEYERIMVKAALHAIGLAE